MIRHFTSAVCLFLIFLFCCTTVYAAEKKAPLALSIVIPQSGKAEERQVTIGGKPPQFHVLIKNVSNKPRRIWKEWCSWGYFNLSFELTIGGKKILLEKKERGWDKNAPSFMTIPPGESAIINVNLAPVVWKNISMIKGSAMDARLKAIYKVAPDKYSKKYNVWTGRIESKALTVSIYY